ncbi:MBL fold metallo-hydrolase [Spirillospora sp. CA-294931]|uniref:MBL fold metallo-hydrolase n=1 Tax=Spirillospora sp. CA-294931 TaxID=3240042 RepID=UPI003D93CF1D
MNLEPRYVAGIEVIPLLDAVGPMGGSLRRPPPELFPGAPDDLWERVREREPRVFGPEGEWVLHFYCYLLRVPGGPTVLVDAGLGPADSPAASWAPVPGAVAEALDRAGTSPGEIDVLVLTHLHSDHSAGAVADGRPLFGNARHLVQRRELDAADPVIAERVLAPLREAELLDAVEDESRLAPGLLLTPTPGHTPGHQSLIVGDDDLVVTGDLLHHPVQLADPSVTYLYDDDTAAASAVRAELLARVRARGGAIATPHLPDPFIDV